MVSWGGGLEASLTRLVFAAVHWKFSPVRHAFELSGVPFPNGLANWLPLGYLLGSGPVLEFLYGAALVAFVLAWRPAIAMGVVSLLILLAGTIAQSQGAIDHGGQVLTVLSIAQWACFVWAARGGAELPARAHRAFLSVAPVIMAYVYVTSAITKLDVSGLDWIRQGHLIAMQAVKSNASEYYNTLAPGLKEQGHAIAGWILAHPDLTRLVLAAGLLLELSAFLGMLDRRWGLFYAIALLLFHVGVGFTMQIWFTVHMLLLLPFMGHGVYWLLRGVDGLRGANAMPLVRT